MADRLINEDAVMALIDIKVDAARDKLNSLERRAELIAGGNTTPDDGDDFILNKIADLKARISAMGAVRMHLKHIETANG